MSELATSARPYAVAAFKRAKETGAMQNWSQYLAFMSTVTCNNTISSLLDNPKIGKQRVSDLLLEICQEQIDKEAANFLKLLVQNGRLPLLSTISSLFEEYKAEYEGYLDVQVTSAYELTDESFRVLADKLEKALGKKINMNVAVDKSLIGGVLVRAGDQVIDGSIKGRLQQMQKTLQ